MELGVEFRRHSAVDDLRKMMKSDFENFPQDKMQTFVDQCTKSKSTFDGAEYMIKAEFGKEIDVWIIKTTDADIDQPCFIYFHGGAGIAGSAEMYNDHLCRYAVEC